MRIRMLALLALLCLLAGIAGAALAEEEALSYDGFTLMAETETRQLWLHQKRMQVRLVDVESGRVLHSKEMDGQQGNKTIKNMQKSDLYISYIANEKIGTTGSVDNYSLSVDLKGYEVTPLEDGFSVRYTVGDTTLTIDDLPKMVPVEKYNELLLPNWTGANDKLWREHYRVVGNTQWVRVRDTGLGGMVIKQIYALLFEKGNYTFADREADNLAFGHEVEAMNPTFAVTLRYQLDGDDLVVTLPAGEVEAISGHQVTMIEILPYFLTGTTEQHGYMLVPDGSGSLIELNNGKTMALSYISRVYGTDVLKNMRRYQTPSTNITLPVYGIKTDDMAVLAIIEQGAEIAELYADVSARSDEFNRISSRFLLRDIEAISLVGNETITTPRYAEDVYQGEIVLRYKWLFDGEATYTGMAHAYRDHLIARGDLIPHEQEDEAPFYLELIGAFRKQKFILGIPYWSTVQATTFAQAGVVHEAAREAGIENIKVIYSGMFRYGVKNGSLTRAGLDGGMGGTAALDAFKAQVADSGDMLFPNVYLGRVYDRHDFSRTQHAARKLDGDPAWVTAFAEPIMMLGEMPYASYYVSPHYLPAYIDKATTALSKFGLDGLAVEDLGGVLTPDYRRRMHLSRIHARPVYEGVLADLNDAYALMLSNPNDYALSAADYITGLPMDDNGYQVQDESIPFVQLVLEGSVHYSGPSMNNQAYQGMNLALMRAIETKSAPRFTMTYAPETIFHNTNDPEIQGYLDTQYEKWMPRAAAVYAAYDAFYQQVKDARIAAHEVLARGLRRVTYDNGVTVWLNYGDTEVTLEGFNLAPESYLVKEGT